MKKLYAFITGALLLATTATQAQSPRTVLFEEFTGENCNPCAFTNPYVKQFVSYHATDSFIHIAYQSPIPSAGPIYNGDKTETDARMTYYNVNFAPWGENDGQAYPVQGPTSGPNSVLNNVYYYFDTNSTKVAAASSNPISAGFRQRRDSISPCTVVVTHHFSTNYDSVYAMAIVTTTMNYSSSNLKFRIAMIEEQMNYATPPGTNGETDFYQVVRKMYPSANGTAMATSLSVGHKDTFYVAAKIQAYVRDKSQIRFVAFVQDDNTKEVKQAGISAFAPITGLLSLLAYSDSVQPIACTNTGTSSTFSQVTVKNTGGVTVTTMSIEVKVDGALLSTTPWTGTLTAGNSVNVPVGPLALSSGVHTVQMIVKNPNGNTSYVVTTNDTIKGGTFVAGASAPTPLLQSFEDTSVFPPANYYTNAVSGGYVWLPSRVFNGLSYISKAYWGSQSTQHSMTFACYLAQNGDIADFYTQKVDLTGANRAIMTFDRAHMTYTSMGTVSTDQVDIQASLDCGTNWTTVWTKAGATLSTVTENNNNIDSNYGYFPLAAADWKADTAKLNSMAGHDNVWIRFRGTSNYGDNVWIDQINITKWTVGGIDELSNVEVANVFPSPANDNVTLELGLAKEGNYEVTVINTLGEQVKAVANGAMSQGVHQINVNTGDLSSGIYNFIIRANDQKIVKRFVVAH